MKKRGNREKGRGKGSRRIFDSLLGCTSLVDFYLFQDFSAILFPSIQREGQWAVYYTSP